MNPFERFIRKTAFVLSEGSIYERLRRHPAVAFDPYLAHASLLYDDMAVDLLAEVHRTFGLTMLGGCCGMDTRHIEALARAFRAHQANHPV